MLLLLLLLLMVLLVLVQMLVELNHGNPAAGRTLFGWASEIVQFAQFARACGTQRARCKGAICIILAMLCSCSCIGDSVLVTGVTGTWSGLALRAAT